ncbi:hypothetical protein ABZ318_11230 [Streptomyces sp. NPDC006197]|uniref:hypothetical protein n=1 Tax=Streptomyces sp. NPDC006197 TaxID=3156685 RepID=UPI0033B21A40
MSWPPRVRAPAAVLGWRPWTAGADAPHARAELRRAGQVRLIDSLVVVKSVTGEVSTSELVEYEEYDGATAEIGPEANLLGPEDAAEAARRSNRVRAR